MASVVIIHAADDALPARALGEKLRLAQLTPIIETQGEERQSAIREAALTIALWSPRAAADAEAAEAAAYAQSNGNIVHAAMQSAQPPERFRGEKCVDLTGWRGEDDFPAWRELADIVTDKAGLPPLPAPAPRPPSGFFQPGRPDPEAMSAAAAPPRARAPRPAPAPRQEAPRSEPQRHEPPRRAAPSFDETPRTASESGGGGRMAILAGITFVVVALVGGGGYFLWSQSQNSGDASAWEAVDTGDPAALRAFLDGAPGSYRDDARAALASLEERSFEAAMDANSIEALEAYLNDFPSGENALAARGRIAELQSATAPPETATEELDAETLPPEEEIDPDLLPPNAASAGPVAIAPAPEPTPEPAPIPAPTPTPEPSGGIDLTPPPPSE